MADARSATVGEDATFSGRFRGHDLVVLGRLEGDVELKGSLRVGKQGHVKAKVKAASVDIEGEFEGEVRADTLSLADTARSKGTFIAKRLNVREGAILEGAVNPAGSVPGAVPAPAPTAPPTPTGLTPVTPSAPAQAPPAAAPATPGPTPPSNPQGGHKPEGGGHPGA